MKNIEELFGPWLYCQTKLKKVLRWSKYILYSNGKPARYNGIRRQNVEDHTLSKLLVFSVLLPKLRKIFGTEVDFDLLFSCITYHDLGEGLRGGKYDILSFEKKHSNDVEEYILLVKFLDEVGPKDAFTRNYFEKAFPLQFALTSHESFSFKAQRVMQDMRNNTIERKTAVLFQILEKWEYFFYAYEHKDKHPTIWEDVSKNNKELIKKWIQMYPQKFQKPLEDLFIT